MEIKLESYDWRRKMRDVREREKRIERLLVQ
jgi:hypothetical protein